MKHSEQFWQELAHEVVRSASVPCAGDTAWYDEEVNEFAPEVARLLKEIGKLPIFGGSKNYSFLELIGNAVKDPNRYYRTELVMHRVFRELVSIVSKIKQTKV